MQFLFLLHFHHSNTISSPPLRLFLLFLLLRKTQLFESNGNNHAGPVVFITKNNPISLFESNGNNHVGPIVFITKSNPLGPFESNGNNFAGLELKPKS